MPASLTIARLSVPVNRFRLRAMHRLLRRSCRRACGVVALSIMLQASLAHGWEFFGHVGAELRVFPEDGPRDAARWHPAVLGEWGFEHWHDASEAFVEGRVFARVDQRDAARTLADVRELSVTRVFSPLSQTWEVKAGVSKVFWGVAESNHLVDVINQSDLAADIDGEDKLGQAMVRLSTEQQWGLLSLFWLPHHRERVFPEDDGRFALPLPYDQSATGYESDAEAWRSDAAVRWSHYAGPFEFALSHFSGTSREPQLQVRMTASGPLLVAFYPVIDQSAIEAQWLHEGWLLKLEAMSRSGFGARYSSAVAGFEYTQVGVAGSRADLGWIVEYSFDDRGEQATVFLEDDVFVGWRLAFNDADSTEWLAGVYVDTVRDENIVSLEMSQRLNAHMKLELQARLFDVADTLPAEKIAFLRDEDQLGLTFLFYF